MNIVDNKWYVSDQSFKCMVGDLADKVRKLHPDLLVGVVRGGAIPAVHLSHQLSVPVTMLEWQTRDGDHKEDNEDIKKAILNGKTVVFVDDINDSGLTAKQITEHYGWDLVENPNNVHFAAVIEKASTSHSTSLHSLRMDDDRWLVFPWERI